MHTASRLLPIVVLSMLGFSGVAQASTDPAVTHQEGAAVSARFDVTLNDRPAELFVLATRFELSTSPAGASGGGTFVDVQIQQVDPETFETVFSAGCNAQVPADAFVVRATASAKVQAALACVDNLTGEAFDITLDLQWSGIGPPLDAARDVLRRGARASGTVAFGGTTYQVANSDPGSTQIAHGALSDPWHATTFHGGGGFSAYGGPPCLDASGQGLASAEREDFFVGFSVTATGTFHVHVRGLIEYKVFPLPEFGDLPGIDDPGALYAGELSLVFRESLTPDFDNRLAVIPLTLPMTVTSADGQATRTILVDAFIIIVDQAPSFGPSIQVTISQFRCAPEA